MNFDSNTTPGHPSSFSAIAEQVDQCMDQMRGMEKVESSVVRDFAVSPVDVLCGRGKLSFNHAGNKRFRDLIAASVDRYNDASSRLEKATVVNAVVEEIQASGGRFLRRDEAAGTWHSLGHAQCREKVGHAIRDQSSSIEARKKRQRQQESARKNVATAIMSKSALLPAPAVNNERDNSLSKHLLVGGLGDKVKDNNCYEYNEGNTLHSNIESIVQHFADGNGLQQEEVLSFPQETLTLPQEEDAPCLTEPSPFMKQVQEGMKASDYVKELQSGYIMALSSDGNKTGGARNWGLPDEPDEQEFLDHIDEVLGPLPSDVAANQALFQ